MVGTQGEKRGIVAWTAFLVMLVCAVAALLVTASIGQGDAYADGELAAGAQDGDGDASGDSSEISGDYGWLYRVGNCWYAKHPHDYEHDEYGNNQRQYILDDDGFVYEYWMDYNAYALQRLHWPVEAYYSPGWNATEGEIVYQQGFHTDINRIATEVRGSYIQRYTVPGHHASEGLNTFFSSPGAPYRVAGLERNSLDNYYPYIEGREVVHTVTFEDNFERCFEEAGDADEQARDGDWDAYHNGEVDAKTQSYMQFHPYYLDGWFKDFIGLKEIVGLTYMHTDETLSLAHTFDNCVQLKELDLTSFNTSRCKDFTGMIDNCTSLEKLTFGEGWTQAGADAGERATFPVSMREGEDGGGTSYAAGDVIPDGAATYTCDRTSIRFGDLTLLRPNTRTSNGSDVLTCDYSGSAIEPVPVLYLNGKQLEEGTDYTVSYRDNVQVGTGRVVVTGIGDYYGSLVAEFKIVNEAAYAFLYSDGLLVLKAGSDYLSPSVAAGVSDGSVTRWRWFDSDTAAPGSTVPWDARRSEIKCVMVEKSFAQLMPVSLAQWFENCTWLSEFVGLEHLNTSKVTSMAGMFRGCTSLVNLDLAALTVSNAVDFDSLVSGCTSLETLALGDMGASQGSDFSGLLAGCENLKTLETAASWRNAVDEARQLRLPFECFKTAPSYERYAAGAAMSDGQASYRFSDLAMQFATVTMDKPEYTCTGKPLEPKLEVSLGDAVLVEGVDYTVSYANNVYPGKAKATVIGKGIFSGGLKVPFSIVARVTYVGDRLVYKTKDVTFTFEVTKLKKKGGKVVAVDAALVDVKVLNASLKTVTVPGYCTIGGLVVDITAVNSKITGRFKNATAIVIGARVTLICARAFSGAQSLRRLILTTARLTKVKNCLAGSNINRVEARVYLNKSKRAKYKTWFTKQAGKKGVTFSY